MLLTALGDRRVVFVAGKGGVGKTSVASSLALARARSGARVLLVSTDPAHNVGQVWEQKVGDEPTRVWDGAGFVDAVEIDPQATVDRHLATVADSMRRLLPERMWSSATRHLDVARDAPGTHESAVLERLAETTALGLDHYDFTVFDTAPTGHTVRLMALPERLTAWTESLLANRDRSERFGAVLRGLGGSNTNVDRDAELRRLLVTRQERFSRLSKTITDSTQATFALTLIAESTPVLETIDLHAQLTDLGIDVAALVVNRRSPSDQGSLLTGRRAVEDGHLTTLRKSITQVPVTELPLLGEEPVGEAGLAQIVELLVED